MRSLRESAEELYRLAFPGEAPAFCEALLDAFAPTCLRTVCVEGQVASMLLSIPYRIVTEGGVQDARYLYAVATHPAYRGQGLAGGLLRAEAARGIPVFLRPMREELFAFYRGVGLQPFSPFVTLEGAAGAASGTFRTRTAAEYLEARAAFLRAPFAVPTERFLSLGIDLGGGALELPGQCAALYEREGDRILFREWLGARELLPAATAFLGARCYSARCYEEGGRFFGVGANLPEGTQFLLALD